jgi:hypothetical protein
MIIVARTAIFRELMEDDVLGMFVLLAFLYSTSTHAQPGPDPVVTDATKQQHVINNVTVSAMPNPSMGDTFDPDRWQTDYDLTHIQEAISQTIIGACTLGCPTTGYLWTPEASPITIALNNKSGWNQDTAGNGGRTGEAAVRMYLIANGGGGDTVGMDQEIQIGGAKAGATSFLANPAGSMLSGDLGALNAGVFLQGLGDINLSDNGYDVAAIPLVFNFNRTNNTGALGATWMGMVLHSAGSKSIDSFAGMIGGAAIGIDLSGASLVSRAALAIPAGSGIYFNATNSNANKFSNTTVVGGISISYDATAGEIAIVGAPMQLPAYTVGTLPICGSATKGGMAYVTDATNPTYNGALTGGGTGAAANVPVFCNGIAWTSH